MFDASRKGNDAAGNRVSGIYKIRCVVSGKLYIGSSVNIKNRWTAHKRMLRQEEHPSPRLQSAWNKHGEENFEWDVIEECEVDALLIREQFHISRLKPDYNSMPIVRVITKEMRAKATAKLRARSALITHCPHGHLYDEENTYRDKKGKRCRICNAERLKIIRSNETSEQRDARRKQIAKYNASSVVQKEKRRLYALAHKAEKREYDRLLRLKKKHAQNHHGGASGRRIVVFDHFRRD